MDINYQYSDIRPEFVTCDRNLGRKEYTLSFDVEELAAKEKSDGRKFKYLVVTLLPGIYNRGAVIARLVSSRYSNDEMQAIVNNYLLDEGDEEVVAEFKAMQDWRKHCKKIADEFLAAIAN